MSVKVQLSQRFVQKLREQSHEVSDKIFHIIERIKDGDVIDAMILVEHKSRRFYKLRINYDLFIIYYFEDGNESCTIVDLVSHRETHGLMRPSK